MKNQSTTAQAVRVWDLPTRVFHWTLLAAVVGAIVTAKIGGNALVWHMRLGLFITTLLMWRLLWGFFGGHYSRFVSFIYSPVTTLAYLRGKAAPAASVGHNPLGAGSVFALLVVLLVQAGTGWVADDEIANTGPLAKYVAAATALGANAYHKSWGQWALMTLVGLHVGAIAFYYFVKRDNLVSPMVHGDKQVTDAVPQSNDAVKNRLFALGLWLGCAGLVAFVVVRWG